jgi:hypothetical protein
LLVIVSRWNLFNTFSGFVFNAGLKQWSLFFHAGRIAKPVQFIAPIAYVDHVLLIILLGWGYARLRDKRWSDIAVLRDKAQKMALAKHQGGASRYSEICAQFSTGRE